jgi:phosphoglycerol transferase MdoB-like AlkP superfamily enzyme
MSSYHIQLPPVPKPEDFGITQNEWSNTDNSSVDTQTTNSRQKIRAYKEAVEAWKQAVSSLNNSN